MMNVGLLLAVWRCIGFHINDGGERGIRTLGAVFDSTHDFQSCSFSQLGHLSAFQRDS